MPRPPRILLSQSFYHIMTRGNNRHIVFKQDDDYRCYLKLIDKYKTLHPFDLYHYSFMPNHTHYLIQTKSAPDFAIFMKKLNLAYYHYYNRQYGWIGHFWQDRYKSKPVGKDNYFIQSGKYIELNAVRAKIVEKPEDYKWSSYNHYAFGEKNDLITEDFFYRDLDNNSINRQKKYREMLIDNLVVISYPKPIWGSVLQAKNEQNKIDYCLNKTIIRKQQ